MGATANQNLFSINDSEEVEFTFENDRTRVGEIEAALNELANAISFQGGFEGAEVESGLTFNTSVRVLPGRVLTDQGVRRLVTLGTTVADFTNAAFQAGDGLGGAVFTDPSGVVPPVAGSFLALHVIVDQADVFRLAYSNVAPIPEDSIPTLGVNDIGSKILAILPIRENGAAGGELAPAFVDNIGPDLRSVNLRDPDGTFNSQVPSDQDVAAGSTTNIVALNGVPTTDVRRNVRVALQVEVGAVGDDASLANFGSTAPVVTSRRVVAAQDGPRVAATLQTAADGRTVHVLHASAAAASALRTIGYDTFLGH